MILATNKKAYFDYQILKTYEAGIELYGFEVKAAKFPASINVLENLSLLTLR